MPESWLEEWNARVAAERARKQAEADAIRACPLVSPEGRLARQGALTRACWMCGAPLPPRRQKWCSDACAIGDRGWFTLHEWSRAALWALRRDGYRCRRCGDRAGAVRKHWRYSEGWRPGEECWDFACTDQHDVSAGRLQVDHIVPREGRGYDQSCAHHPENLQTLCVPCHAIKGVIFRAIMEALRRASVVALPTGERLFQLTLALPDEAPRP